MEQTTCPKSQNDYAQRKRVNTIQLSYCETADIIEWLDELVTSTGLIIDESKAQYIAESIRKFIPYARLNEMYNAINAMVMGNINTDNKRITPKLIVQIYREYSCFAKKGKEKIHSQSYMPGEGERAEIRKTFVVSVLKMFDYYVKTGSLGVGTMLYIRDEFFRLKLINHDEKLRTESYLMNERDEIRGSKDIFKAVMMGYNSQEYYYSEKLIKKYFDMLIFNNEHLSNYFNQ